MQSVLDINILVHEMYYLYSPLRLLAKIIRLLFRKGTNEPKAQREAARKQKRMVHFRPQINERSFAVSWLHCTRVANKRTNMRACVRACVRAFVKSTAAVFRATAEWACRENDAIVNGDSPPYNSEISILRERGHRLLI